MPLESTRQAQSAVADLRATVARVRTVRVGDDIRRRARMLVDDYFRNLEPKLVSAVGADEALATLGAQMQELLVLGHGQSRKTSYVSTLNKLKRAFDALEVRLTAARPPPAREATTTEIQARILKTLGEMCPPAAASYAQALADLATDRRSWRGPAVDLREALRELLDTLAPDEEVMKIAGFKLEDGAKGPTMKQKTRFILKAREQSSDARKPVEDAVNVIEDQVGAFVRSVYTRASGSVHVQRSKREVLSIQRFVETAMVEILQL